MRDGCQLRVKDKPTSDLYTIPKPVDGDIIDQGFRLNPYISSFTEDNEFITKSLRGLIFVTRNDVGLGDIGRRKRGS